ncbi:MAG: excinuclease ABC subunit UvrC [Flavobacteriales bacterium]|nr:excinuclease ABC subunit UvrC [Flavobacteriales bacterium]MBP6697432.1 excinuclease ABC subunit UvrC [Flavobacteriales bacterium]
MADLDVREKVRLLPDEPGIYQFLDGEGKILYVGKAKSLRDRVSSYFAKDLPNGKTAALVRHIADLRTLVVNSEFEALLLENTLIKEHQPRYNILLRDDKSFPWIRIRNEHFPRVEGMRNPEDDGSTYYGPFTSAKSMRTLLQLMRGMYQLRSCNYDLSPRNIEKGKFKRCLEYHIGNCKGPCEGLQEEVEYDSNVDQVRQMAKGRISGLVRTLKQQMAQQAEALAFEEAESTRMKIERLEKFHSRGVVVNMDVGDMDVFGLAGDASMTCVNYLRVVEGAIVHGVTIEMKRRLEETEQELLQLAIAELRQRYMSNAPEALVPFDPGIEVPGVTFIVPQRGDQRKLLELCQRNAHFFFLEKQKQEKLVDPEASTNRVLEQIKQDLRLNDLPRHIECFDNSNTQGTDPVSACVVFKDAKPSKKDYRHFNIRTVEGPDDFASMEEAVERRYARLLGEGEPLPQLVVIDGGKGQLHAATNVFDRLGLRGKIALVGIAKRLEELYFPDDPVPLHIDKRSSTLKVIQQMRDEAHRFGITHHRGKRSKRIIRTGLEDVPGIGPETARRLLTRFGSIKGVREAPPEEIVAEVGAKKAEILLKGLS